MSVKGLYALVFGVALAFGSIIQHVSLAQGCVAIRNISGGTNLFSDDAKTWLFSANYRYFHSYKHFVGTEEQTHRVEEKTNVINNDHSLTLGANYNLNQRWNFTVSIPFVYIDRSSLYEHWSGAPGNPRFHTSSQGLGDIRLLVNYKAVDAAKLKLQVGLGVKLPTGNYKYQDYFHKQGSEGQDSLVLRYVDQSIQPGDGGLGAIVSFDALYLFNERWSAYASGMYLSNPRNTNGVERSNTLTNDANNNPIPLSNEFSVVDQYFIRAGGRVLLTSKFEFSLGGRFECIPVYDLIGGEDGFRRPGYILSIDPALFYVHGKHIFSLNIPVALERNRTRSYIDILRGNDANGNPRHGDAAFADFLVSFSYAFKLGKKAVNPFGNGQEVVK